MAGHPVETEWDFSLETRRNEHTATFKDAHHTVPYGTAPALPTFLAVNCQATFNQSLRGLSDFPLGERI